MEPADASVTQQLYQLLSRRGWAASETGTSVTAHKHDWPAQLRLLVDPGSATERSILGLTLDFRSMPLGGERFRDIFNMEKEEILRGMGSFRVREMRGNGWTDGVSDRIFLHGIEGGINRATDVVLFDRSLAESGAAILDAFGVESGRLLETGGQVAKLLQRTYNRTVLRNDAPMAGLPDMVSASIQAPSPTVLGEPSYPWRR
ncbi:MAG: hypothetical protein M3O87_08060 [Candidatus Dormibacteraeota bacterium]|nr:hypothetical protein [Candidatus Dormibacteraeota bacterium]